MLPSGKIMIATSRNPTPTIRALCNDFARVVLHAVRVNRGKMSIDDVAEKAFEHGADRVMIVERSVRGTGEIGFLQTGEAGLVSVLPIIRIASMTLQREFKNLSRVKPSQSLNTLSPISNARFARTAEALSKFFGLPILSREEAVKNGHMSLCLSREKTGRMVMTFVTKPKRVETGPRAIFEALGL